MRSVRQAFELGTATFNAHDIEGFAAVLADDVVFDAPGGIHGEGKAACAEFFASWFAAFPDAHVEVNDLVVGDDAAIEEATFTGTHNGVLHTPNGDIPPDRPWHQYQLHPGASLSRRQPHLVSPHVRPARHAGTARRHLDTSADRSAIGIADHREAPPTAAARMSLAVSRRVRSVRPTGGQPGFVTSCGVESIRRKGSRQPKRYV